MRLKGKGHSIRNYIIIALIILSIIGSGCVSLNQTNISNVTIPNITIPNVTIPNISNISNIPNISNITVNNFSFKNLSINNSSEKNQNVKNNSDNSDPDSVDSEENNTDLAPSETENVIDNVSWIIKISGPEGLMFKGVYVDRYGPPIYVNDIVPKEYTIRSDILAVKFQNTKQNGMFSIEIMRNGQIVANNSTEDSLAYVCNTECYSS